MNRMLVVVSVAFTVVLFGNCKGSRLVTDSGEAVEYISIFWKRTNNVDTPAWTFRQNAWYQDSVGITQICSVFNIETDTSRITTIETTGYRLVDLRRKWAYEYGSFSDTASIKSKYRYTDSTVLTGGWNFANRTPILFDSIHPLPDTIINSIVFKRRILYFEFNHARFESIGMFRCDNKSTHFVIDTAISNKTGCPLVFFRMNPLNQPHARLDQEINFISNSFPDSVRKVFAAWKKNEQTNSVE